MIEVLLAWGELHIILCHYSKEKYIHSIDVVHKVSPEWNLTPVHYYLDGSDCSALYKYCLRTSDGKSLWVQLVIQKLKWIDLFQESDDEEITISLNKIFTFFQEIHDTLVDDKSIKNLWVAMSKFTSAFSLRCSQEQKMMFMKILMTKLQETENEDAIFWKYLKSDEFIECAPFHSILSEIILTRTMELVSQTNMMKKDQCVQSAFRDNMINLISHKFSLLAEKNEEQSADGMHRFFSTIIKVLEIVHPNSFDKANNVWLFSSVVLILMSSPAIELINGCLKSIQLLIDGPICMEFFLFVKPSFYCLWFKELHESFDNQESSCIELYEFIISQSVKHFCSNLELIKDCSEFVCKLNTSLEDIFQKLVSSDESLDATDGILLSHVNIYLKAFTKVLSFKSLKADIIEVCGESFQSLSNGCIKIHDVIYEKYPNIMEKENFKSTLIETSAILLQYMQAHPDTEHNALFLSNIRHAADLSLSCLDNSQNLLTLQKALFFIRKSCYKYGAVKSIYPVEFLQNVLQQLIKICINPIYHSGKSKSALDSDEKSIVLPDAHSGLPSNVNHHASSVSNSLKSLKRTGLLESISNVMKSLSIQNFIPNLDSILNNINSSEALCNTSLVITAIEIYDLLLKEDLSSPKQKIMYQRSQNVVIKIQEISRCLRNSKYSLIKVQCLKVILCLQTTMLDYGDTLLTPQSVGICLNSCSHIDMEELPLKQFVTLFQRIYESLNSSLINHENAMMQRIPPFLCAVKFLLKSLVTRSKQNILSIDEEDYLDSSAQLMTRLLALLSSHKADFARVSPYIIAHYIESIHNLTLIPKIKNTILRGIFSLLSLCDQHSIALIHANLSTGDYEIFRIIHNDFKKYFEYKGKV